MDIYSFQDWSYSILNIGQLEYLCAKQHCNVMRYTKSIINKEQSAIDSISHVSTAISERAHLVEGITD